MPSTPQTAHEHCASCFIPPFASTPYRQTPRGVLRAVTCLSLQWLLHASRLRKHRRGYLGLTTSQNGGLFPLRQFLWGWAGGERKGFAVDRRRLRCGCRPIGIPPRIPIPHPPPLLPRRLPPTSQPSIRRSQSLERPEGPPLSRPVPCPTGDGPGPEEKAFVAKEFNEYTEVDRAPLPTFLATPPPRPTPATCIFVLGHICARRHFLGFLRYVRGETDKGPTRHRSPDIAVHPHPPLRQQMASQCNPMISAAFPPHFPKADTLKGGPAILLLSSSYSLEPAGTRNASWRGASSTSRLPPPHPDRLTAAPSQHQCWVWVREGV